MTCSQLSSTTIASRAARWAASASCAERCAGIGTPTASAVGLGHELAVAEAGELHEPDPVGRGVDLRQRLDGQARLAAATRADQREQAHAFEQAHDLAALALAADEGGQGLGEVAGRVSRGPRGQQLAVKGTGLGIGLGGELGLELLAQQLVLRQRLLAAARDRVEPHQGAVRGLGQRIDMQRALERGDRLGVVAVELGQLDAQGAMELEQRGAACVGPRLVAVLGEQLPGVDVERRLVGADVAGRAGVGGGRLERFDVDLGLEGDDAVAEAQRARADGAARGVQDLMEVVGRGLGVAVGPQEVGQALAVEPALGGEGEELHERLGLAQAPRAPLDEAVLRRDGEAAQQAYAR
jgi:hypothetical protein